MVNSVGMRFVLVPAGEFVMGSRNEQANPICPDSQPPHRVRITKPFYLGAFEVTQAQYAAIMDVRLTHPIVPFFSKSGGGASLIDGVETAELPIDNVSWNEAGEFCRRLSELPEERAARRRYRLPTEAEWEYACRAGTQTPFACGETLSPANANTSQRLGTPDIIEPLGRLATVGSYSPNGFGLYDMHGNVWEWCDDSMRPYTSATVSDPRGPEGVYRALRGGSWETPAAYCRSDYRTNALAGYVFAGLRVCVRNRRQS